MYDPLKPFIAQDGLEYDDLAAYICDQPQDTWRNREIAEARAEGQPEETVRAWIKLYDGDDPCTTQELPAARADYKKRAAGHLACPF